MKSDKAFLFLLSTSVLKALKFFLLAATSSCWSGNSRRLHLGLESLEMAKFGHAGHASRAASTTVANISFLIAPSPPWSEKSRRLHFERESRAASTAIAMK